MTNRPARAARYVEPQGNDELARSGRALCGAARQRKLARYVEQQGNDKLARSGCALYAMWSSKAMIIWPARAARYVEQQGNVQLARSGRALWEQQGNDKLARCQQISQRKFGQNEPSIACELTRACRHGERAVG